MKSAIGRLELILAIGSILLIVVLMYITINNSKQFRATNYIITSNNNIYKPGRNYIINQKYVEYRKLEGKMIIATQKYLNQKYSDGLAEGFNSFVPVANLINYSLLSEFNDPFDSGSRCSGYVRVLKVSSLIDYQPYLKCGNSYETVGYIERLDEK